MIHNCDKFTKEWYKENMGYNEEDFEPVDIREERPPIPQNALPPYNGFGSYEDSLMNCLDLNVQPPRKDFQKLFNYQHKALRFICRMIEDDVHVLTPAERDRKFVLTYHLYDDTISVYEPPLRNSGIIGGKFLERGVVRKPGSWQNYKAPEFYVGAVVELNNRLFELTEADNFTYKVMEENPADFPFSDFRRVIDRLCSQAEGKGEELRTAFIDMDVDGSGHLNEEELHSALTSVDISLEKQEIITIIRHFDVNHDGRLSIEKLLSELGI